MSAEELSAEDVAREVNPAARGDRAGERGPGPLCLRVGKSGLGVRLDRLRLRRAVPLRPVPSTGTCRIDLEHRRDVIETPIEGVWDVNGWDLRKALQLYYKSNPPLSEWFQSPIVYREASSIRQRLLDVQPQTYSPRAAMYHYLHMARRNNREFLRGETVRRKKYFYVLRPLLACRWLEEARGPVPIEFDRLLEVLPEALRPDV